MRSAVVLLGAFAAIVGLSTGARTQAVPPVTAEVQQLRQKNSELEAANADLRQQLAGAQAVALMAKGQHSGVQQAKDILARNRATVEQANAQALQATGERDKAIGSLAGMRSVLAACQEKNNRLVDVSREILNAYDHTGFFDAVFESEPVLQVKRVELEKIAQDRSDRIEQGRFTMPQDPTTGQK